MADVTSAVALATRVLISQVSRATKRLFTNVCAGQQPPVGAADPCLDAPDRCSPLPFPLPESDIQEAGTMSIAIMNWVWANSPTSGNERLALADACSRDDGTGYLPSAATIGRKANLSDRTVPRVIARLEADGHVVVHRGMAASPPPDQRRQNPC